MVSLDIRSDISAIISNDAFFQGKESNKERDGLSMFISSGEQNLFCLQYYEADIFWPLILLNGPGR